MTARGRGVRRLAATLVCVILAAGGFSREWVAAAPGVVDDARLRKASADPDNWVTPGGDLGGDYYSPLNQINLANVQALGPAWFYEFDTTRGQESEPLVVDGVMYVTSAWSKVYALNAATGEEIWRFDPEVPGEAGVNACCDVVNRGAAVYKGKVYVGTIDGRLIALDAATGKVVWRVQTTDTSKPYTITGAPRVVKDKVIIGNGGADLNVRGYVTAYEAETGKQAWRFYLVPGNPADGPDGAASDPVMARLALPTWAGEWWKWGGGGTAWNAIAYDPDFDQLYIGTGNGSPWSRNVRSAGWGDNLFLASVVALDPETGAYRWHYQQNPGESWDFNSVMPFIQTEMDIAGARRKVLFHAPKNGYFYILDRENGRLLAAYPFVDNINWTTGIDPATGRPQERAGSRYETEPFKVVPGPAGGHDWRPMAYSGETGLVYFPAKQSAMLLSDLAEYKAEYGTSNAGVNRTGFPSTAHFLALDPKTGKIAWKADADGGGALATGGGLVFQGRGKVLGEMVAYRATDGKEVWTYPMPSTASAAPITYRIAGEQYIAIVTGAGGPGLLGGGSPVSYGAQPGRVIVFKLGGAVKLPDDPGGAPPLNPAPDTWPAAAIAQGKDLYAQYCRRCHGADAESANIVPDLRRSVALSSAELWKAIVHDGALSGNGMIAWRALTPGQGELIRAYVSDQARKRQAAGDPPATRETHRALQPTQGADQ